MRKLIDEKNFIVSEIEESDIDKWIKEEFRNCHPENLIKATFPKKIMDIICSDHHKSKDGGFIISYDFWDDKWYIFHHGYIREVEVEGKTFLEVARKYLRKIERENERVLYREIEEEANKLLPKNISIEISEGSISVYDYSKGEDNLKCIANYDIENKTVKKVVRKVNEILKETY